MGLICALVFAYAKSRFSHDMAHLAFEANFISFCNIIYVYLYVAKRKFMRSDFFGQITLSEKSVEN